MKKYGLNELRKMYLEFFESKGHLKMNSFSLLTVSIVTNVFLFRNYYVYGKSFLMIRYEI